MRCTKCGAELGEGFVFCSKCGSESEVVAEVGLLEDDLLRSMIGEEEEEQSLGLTKELDAVYVEEISQEEREQIKKSAQEAAQKQKKRKQRVFVTCIVILIALIIAGLSLIRYQQTHSVDYLMEKAQSAYETKDYTESLKYLDRVLELDIYNKDALLLDGKIQTSMKDYETAERMLQSALELDPENIEVYKSLLELYKKLDSHTAIIKLMKQAPNDEIAALFADYVVPVPSFDVVGDGTEVYEDSVEVIINCDDPELEIHYTTDNTAPNKESTLYQDSVLLEDEGVTTLRAICVNSYGDISEEIVQKYTIKYVAPEAPKVTPDGGKFSESQKVTIDVKEDTTVYYTWDDTEPSASSSKYTGPIEIPEGNNVLSVIAIDKHNLKSVVQQYNYVYYPEVTEDPESENQGDQPAEE